MDALNKYDPGKNIQFKTYAEYRIRGAMLDELRSLDLVSRSYRSKYNKLKQVRENLAKGREEPVGDEEIAQAMDLSLDAYYALLRAVQVSWVSDFGNQESKLLPGDYCAPLNLADQERSGDPYQLFSAEELQEGLRRLIEELHPKEKRVIFLYYYEELTLKEIGEIIGFSESRICQIHGQAIHKLHTRLTKSFPCESEEKGRKKLEATEQRSGRLKIESGA